MRVPPDEVVFTLESSPSIRTFSLRRKKRTRREELSSHSPKTITSKLSDVQTKLISVEPKYNTDDLEYGNERRGISAFSGLRGTQKLSLSIERYFQV